jgi:hypothetical protein
LITRQVGDSGPGSFFKLLSFGLLLGGPGGRIKVSELRETVENGISFEGGRSGVSGLASRGLGILLATVLQMNWRLEWFGDFDIHLLCCVVPITPLLYYHRSYFINNTVSLTFSAFAMHHKKSPFKNKHIKN